MSKMYRSIVLKVNFLTFVGTATKLSPTSTMSPFLNVWGFAMRGLKNTY